MKIRLWFILTALFFILNPSLHAGFGHGGNVQLQVDFEGDAEGADQTETPNSGTFTRNAAFGDYSGLGQMDTDTAPRTFFDTPYDGFRTRFRYTKSEPFTHYGGYGYWGFDPDAKSYAAGNPFEDDDWDDWDDDEGSGFRIRLSPEALERLRQAFEDEHNALRHVPTGLFISPDSYDTESTSENDGYGSLDGLKLKLSTPFVLDTGDAGSILDQMGGTSGGLPGATFQGDPARGTSNSTQESGSTEDVALRYAGEFGGLRVAAGETIPQPTQTQLQDAGYGELENALKGGGFIRDAGAQGNNADSVPVLGDLPVVGQAFRNSGTATSNSNLTVTLTPQITSEAE